MAPGRKAKRRREGACRGVLAAEPGSVEVTPQRPRKRHRIRRRGRKPDPCLSSLSHTSSGSSVSMSNSAEIEKVSCARRKLGFSSKTSDTPKPWTEEEVKALVNYLLCRGQTKVWTASKNTEFWDSASTFVADCTSEHKRTGNACRNKVLNTLRKRFKSPEDAEAHYFPLKVPACDPVCTADEVSITHTIQPLQPSPRQQLQVLSETFTTYCATHSGVAVPKDFLILAVSAMEHLESCGRSNVVYNLAKVLGRMRNDKSDSLLPAKRMPMGLIEHCVNFFSSSSIREIQCPDDYRQWLVSMFSLFGTKFVKLYCGPMWRVETTSQDSDMLSSSKSPVEARTNVPGLSERTLQRDIVASGITMGAGIQTLLLDSAVRSNPHAFWWIKGDGCDIVPGLCESVQLKWSGDVDLNTGELQRSYETYKLRLKFVSEIGLKSRQERSMILEDLKKLHTQLVTDKDFAISELANADADYHSKLQTKEKSTKSLFDAGWKVEELKNLVDCYQRTIATVASVTEVVADSSLNLMDLNIARRLSNIRDAVTGLIRDLSRHHRAAATHIFVFMISSEQREAKPYALPVQCIPYKSLNQQHMRQLVSNLIKEMTSRGMKIAGFCSNGEYNAMRSQGYTRPLSVFKIRSNIRSKYAKMSKAKMLAMLSSKVAMIGKRVANVPNAAVSEDLLAEVATLKDQGLEWSDIIARLRPRTVPAGYAYCPWKPGTLCKDETEIDMLRSILAQLEFTYVVKQYNDSGVLFRTHLHVPEVHPDTKTVFLEREDEGHVLKRIAQCTRNGGPRLLQLERYVEALSDNEAGLTYPALVGTRKQSVEDAERLFSPALLKFMEKKGYTYEAKYIGAVLGWRQACDLRGLSELERCRRNYVLLNFILEELMPWSRETYDFSLLEVNRDITKVCGFTREVLTALVANIETREWRRQEISQHSYNPENPRASNTDDVECFFSVMRDHIGANFTLKQAQFGWRKVCLEFQKRIDADLPFYYFTSAHDRFYEGVRPSFNEPSKKAKKQRLPRGEQAVSISSGRATLPIRGTLTIRPQFHKHPVSVPPPSTVSAHISEHSYC